MADVEVMEKANLLGMSMAIVGAILGTVGMLFLFLSVYGLQIATEVSRGAPVEALLVTFILPGLTVVSMVGGVIWAVAAYGIATGQEWSFAASITASILCILAGFFPILPYVSSGLGFPPTFVIFAVNLLFFILLQTRVRPTGKQTLLLSLATGIAFVLAFISGIASIHYILTTGDPLFIALQPLNLIASISWSVVTVAAVLKRGWVRPFAVGSSLAALIGGVPLAVVTQLELARPSLFWPSPIAAAIVLLILYKTRVSGAKNP